MREITLDECQDALERVPDADVYPGIPKITLAPGEINGPLHIKQPGLHLYGAEDTTPAWIVRNVLQEVLMMEKICKAQPPNIIKYYGCRSRRGHITSIVLEHHEYTLTQYIRKPEFHHMNKDRFIDALDSAVSHIHSLGLAHNDINPHHIMIGDDEQPVLLDFGCCAPYGQRLESLGSRGWYEESFFTSKKSHDMMISL